MILYLLHYNEPIGTPQTDEQRGRYNLPARVRPFQPRAIHYIGIAKNLTRRLDHHASGTGSHFTQRAHAQGISFTLARTWEGATREDERRLKAQKNAARYCPICNPETAYKHDIKRSILNDLSSVESPLCPAQCDEIPF